MLLEVMLISSTTSWDGTKSYYDSILNWSFRYVVLILCILLNVHQICWMGNMRRIFIRKYTYEYTYIYILYPPLLMFKEKRSQIYSGNVRLVYMTECVVLKTCCASWYKYTLTDWIYVITKTAETKNSLWIRNGLLRVCVRSPTLIVCTHTTT